jgi:hypothetical protein
MSLISIRNFAGPFRSKLQMGGLAIVILLVLVIRLGTARTNDREVAVDTQGRDSDELLEVLNETRRSKPSRAEKPKDDLLDGLVAEGLEEQPVKNGGQPAKNESFDDIRRSLGLE